jgi:FAD/FMN-containing dehydrogenase
MHAQATIDQAGLERALRPAVPGGVRSEVIDNSKYVSGIGAVDEKPRLDTAEPGPINQRLNRKTGEKNLDFGPDSSSHSPVARPAASPIASSSRCSRAERHIRTSSSGLR